jgi:hypothetical protein
MPDEVNLAHELVPRRMEDVSHVQDNLEVLRNKVNGELGPGNLASAAVSPAKLELELGWLVSSPLVGARAFSSQMRQDDIVSTTYTAGPFPDRVTVNVAANEILMVAFNGYIWNDVINTGRAALFLNGSQLMTLGTDGTALSEAALGAAGVWHRLCSTSQGLECGQATVQQELGDSLPMVPKPSGTVSGSGFWCAINVPGGSYTVEVRYRATSGRIATIYRRLWARTIAFAQREPQTMQYILSEFPLAQGPPLGGELRLDYPAVDAELIYVSNYDREGIDRTSELAQYNEGATLELIKPESGQWARYTVTSSLAQTGTRRYEVQWADGGLALTPGYYELSFTRGPP